MAAESKTLFECLPSERAQQVRATLPQQISIPTEGLITLSGGTPDFPTPPHIVEAGRKALVDGHTTYTAWAGIPPLREAIAEKLMRENDLKADPESEIIVTAGSQAAVLSLVLALVNPGDEVIVPVPFHDEYRRVLLLAGGILVPTRTTDEDDFEIDPDESIVLVDEMQRYLFTGDLLYDPSLDYVGQVPSYNDTILLETLNRLQSYSLM